MRTLKISLLVFILSITISAQWYQQNSGTSNTFYFVQFVTEQVGWAAAYSTTQVLFKTTNGGQVWQLQYNSQNPVFQLFFINENVGWMSTWTTGPLILKTIDGGENWMQVYSYPYAYEYIRDMEFINPATGWFVGEETISYGMITNYDNLEFPVLFKETTDGGATWVEKNFPLNYPGGLRQIEALDYMNLIVTGYDTLFKTTNGGVSWHKYPLPQFGDNKIQFINMNIGWSCMGGKLFKTIDGGEYWYQQAQPVYNFQFITSQIGWYTYSNQIYTSTNGGSSWTLQNSNTNNTLNDIFFIDNNNGWAVGNNGTIIHTINGGIPVELISFTAEVSANEVKLTWSTATETNNSGFEILRSTKDNDWNKIGFIPGHGTTTETQHYTFTDNDVQSGKYQYKLKQIDYDGTFEYSQIVEVEVPIVNEFSLSQNYPNPFNPNTVISYQLPVTSNVTLIVYDLLGRKVAILVNEGKPVGEYEVSFNAANLPSGIYFYQLLVSALQSKDGKAGQFSETRKMILLK